MKSSFPIYEIDGTEFCVDVDKEALWQRNNPSNSISFNDVQPVTDGPGYTFLYDRLSKNVVRSFPEEAWEEGRYLRVTLQALMELDLPRLSEKYGIPLELLTTGKESKLPGKLIAETVLLREEGTNFY